MGGTDEKGQMLSATVISHLGLRVRGKMFTEMRTIVLVRLQLYWSFVVHCKALIMLETFSTEKHCVPHGCW